MVRFCGKEKNKTVAGGYKANRGSPHDENMSLVKADMLRRSGKFDELISEYENKQYLETLLNEILAFEIEKAKDEDRACYTVADDQGSDSCDCAEKGKETIISKIKRLLHKENDSF